MELDYKQVDVFTSTPFQGNPVAVVFDADHLSSQQMQRIANWMNLSETTFVQTSSLGDYKLRIFTPRSELAFAGHPTIGSAFAVLQSGKIAPKQNELFQECNAGLVRLIIQGDSIFAKVPRVKILDYTLPVSEFEDALGCELADEPVAISSGPVWAVSSVNSYFHLHKIRFNTEKVINLSEKYNLTGITVYSMAPGKGVFVRTFAPIVGIMEDPVCGSGNAAVAAHLKHTGRQDVFGNNYTAYQGESVGRKGTIQIRYENDDILIGGEAVLIINGTIIA